MLGVIEIKKFKNIYRFPELCRIIGGNQKIKVKNWREIQNVEKPLKSQTESQKIEKKKKNSVVRRNSNKSKRGQNEEK